MSERFKDKFAIVSGGGSGIGLEIVAQLLREGASVAILDIKRAPEAFDERLSAAQFRHCDVSDEASVEAAIGGLLDVWPRIDLVVNSAGIATKGLVHELQLATWHSVLGVNLTGTFLVSKAAVRAMLERNTRGSIVNIASVDAHAAERSELAYNVSKAGVLALTRTFAVELGAIGIRVNSISPGYVLTPMTRAGGASDPAVLELLTQGRFDRVPIRRGLEPQEIAESCCFLLSDAAMGITGQDLIVDGGLLADAYLVSAMRAAVGKPDTAPPVLR